MKTIPLTKPSFDLTDKEALTKPLDTGWVMQGPYVAEFEKVFARYTGTKYAQATSNGTTALHLALLALGIGPQDKVVVPAFTYIATANAVTYTGAQVVFCDIDLKTFNIDVNKLTELLAREKNIKAIIPVHLFGLCADMTEIMRLANDYHIPIIEDAACALGAKIGEQHAGSFGLAGCFSFHPRKIITTGEGGMVVMQSESVAEFIKKHKNHGATIAQDNIDFETLGYNYRMTDFQGALGLSQMKKLSNILSRRAQIAARYCDALANHPLLHLPTAPKNYTHVYQSFVCLFGMPEENNVEPALIAKWHLARNQFMEKLAAHGIATRQGTHAIHALTYYQKKYALNKEDFPAAYLADQLSITLPMYPDMQDDELNYVIDALNCLGLN